MLATVDLLQLSAGRLEIFRRLRAQKRACTQAEISAREASAGHLQRGYHKCFLTGVADGGVKKMTKRSAAFVANYRLQHEVHEGLR